MSSTQTSNDVTDRTNDVSENGVSAESIVTDSYVNVINDDPQEMNEDDKSMPVMRKERPNYEVVFFARYNTNLRPSVEEITKFFNNYGTVHHVNCPEGRNYAFVFMTSLNTNAEHRRTRSTISQIIQDMTPETRFHLTVASSNRGTHHRLAVRHNNYHYRHQMFRPRRYRNFGNRYGYDNSGRTYVRNRDDSVPTQYNSNEHPDVRKIRYHTPKNGRKPYIRNRNSGTSEQTSYYQKQPQNKQTGTYNMEEPFTKINTNQKYERQYRKMQKNSLAKQ